MSSELEVGENFESWEHRIDYQLAFAHDRIDTCRDADRWCAEELGKLQARLDRTDMILAVVQDRTRRTTTALGVGLVVALLAACIALGLAMA